MTSDDGAVDAKKVGNLGLSSPDGLTGGVDIKNDFAFGALIDFDLGFFGLCGFCGHGPPISYIFILA